MADIHQVTNMKGSTEQGFAYRGDGEARDHLEPGSGVKSTTHNGFRHYEEERLIHAPADEVFGAVDVFQNLSKHMAEPNWRMLWGWMKATTDAGGGQEVGSVVSLNGGFLGIKLAVVEKVTRREPPYRKSWQSFGSISLIVIGHYTMGFEIVPQGNCSKMTAYIDYELPKSARTRWLGRLLSDLYAKWCVREILRVGEGGAQTHGGAH